MKTRNGIIDQYYEELYQIYLQVPLYDLQKVQKLKEEFLAYKLILTVFASKAHFKTLTYPLTFNSEIIAADITEASNAEEQSRRKWHFEKAAFLLSNDICSLLEILKLLSRH